MARQFEIIGADRESGAELTFTLEANDAAHAATLANGAGVMVSTVREQPPPLAPSSARPETVAPKAGPRIADVPVPVPPAAAVPGPWSATTVRLWQLAAVLMLVSAVALFGYCANALADAEERLQPLKNAAAKSHFGGPGARSYTVQEVGRDLVEIREHYAPPPAVTGRTEADKKLEAEQARQSMQRAGMYGAAPALVAAAIAAVVIARLNGRRADRQAAA